MERRNFVKNIAAVSALGAIGNTLIASNSATPLVAATKKNKIAPRAITMWDFSWLERRWPGAGYEDWDKALDELTERGYNAVRIDAFPQLVSENPWKTWTLNEVWNVQDWGSPDVIQVQVQPLLNQFIAKCRDRDIKVGLSTWFRRDVDMTLMKIDSAAKMAEIWIKTLKTIGDANLFDAILYVDLCNEWPGDIWCPFFTNDPPEQTLGYWQTDKSMKFMKESVELVRAAYPELPLCYSFTGGQPALYGEKDLSFFNLIEHHCWIAQLNDNEYSKAVGYNYERFSPVGYKNLVKNSERVYLEKKEYWHKLLRDEITVIAGAAKKANQPLITTECWGIVDFKDWPGLNWEIVKEMCAVGVKAAAETGQWIAIATSNFAGPQFVGMWRDIDYHRKLTDLIKSSAIQPELIGKNICKRLI
ncbi:MAG: hypothetical protein JZU47_14410 [Prolixibacteraceae bacterium]|nr:hypothetical protein [Prolixibacteraceae bacterium]